MGDDVLLKLLDQLEYQDLLACESVCRRWMALLRSNLCVRETLSLPLASHRDNFNARQQLKYLRRSLPTLRSLTLTSKADSEVEPTLVMLLAGGSMLQDLTCRAGTQMNARTLSFCGFLGQLTCLIIEEIEAPFQEADLNEALRGLSSLRKLEWCFTVSGAAAMLPACGLPTALTFATQLEHLSMWVLRSPVALRFGAMPATLLSRLSALTTLQLDNAGVTSLPVTVSRLKNLQELSLLRATHGDGAPALAIPVQISCCTALSRLEISSVTVPVDILRIGSLTHLTLDQCRPSPDQLRNISSLTSLAKPRMCNSPGGIPLDSLRVPSTLTALLLDRNWLPRLPSLQSAPWLTQLQKLNLRDNRLSALPPSLQSCTRLTSIDLSWNRILSLRDATTGRDDAKLITGHHSLRQLGLRRTAADPWLPADIQCMLDIAAALKPSARIICCDQAPSDVEHTLDTDTLLISDSIN